MSRNHRVGYWTPVILVEVVPSVAAGDIESIARLGRMVCLYQMCTKTPASAVHVASPVLPRTIASS
jgi:hypothetical protein